ncbi:MFS transporter [Novosphingobium cyanobacteriorum]|uniref:MFS transporter n=1 Tax=Novosphingobium cyanobacteriorum TaxID=3024215 RepID=A0ABT6CNI2_9SPHN|nr:MFS transporter [Novosphingobium cyanobacteriorum]MDF8335469.1 MFS transporter [Novosphingobium cyanobacteriorum]
MPVAPTVGRTVRLGLKENWPQFALLVLVNAFVGGMVGIERTVVPLIGAEQFHLASTTLITSFIVSFGVVKAFANLVSGQLADAWGRKRVLVLGWLFGLPVPFMIIEAPSWEWIVAANALLGINQGLAWSMTVIMKVDLVGPKSRGLAVGLNEFAGYLAVGVTAFLTGYLASRYGLRPVPIYLGIAYAALGLLFSILLVRDTREHVRVETEAHPRQESTVSFSEVFALTSFRNRNLFAASQAGLVNNLNDGMSWGIFPLFFASLGLGVERIGLLKALYPASWGLLQVATGPLSDRWGRKGLIVSGMWVQAAGLVVTGLGNHFGWWVLGSLMLGIGTAMVYPSLIAAVSDASHPSWRARSLSVYRFWRDLGYAIGALSAGLIADAFGFAAAILSIGGLTFLSGVITAIAMRETTPRAELPPSSVNSDADQCASRSQHQ